MKIAFIIPCAVITYSGGIQVQGRMWKKGLENLGHQVDLIDVWGKHDWNSYDYIIIFGIGKILIDYVTALKNYPHPKLISAPIIDYNGGMRNFIIRSRFYGSIRLRFYKPFHDLYYCRNDFNFFLVRSEHERRFITKGFGLNESHTRKVPISYRIEGIPNIDFSKKEDYVFHASRLGDPGKNVERLIKASIKYNFNLTLAGTLNEDRKSWLYNLISGHDNIKYLGWIKDEELYDNYRRAKVLALPSLVEGVGMVALEAAVYGCEIVLTNLGAPKEYWDGRAVLVDPYDIDSIGQGVIEALKRKHAQPQLQKFIINNYSFESCSKKLETCLLNGLQ
jgi:glycosyltransferase involved in cell wall biosynthesis